MHSQDGNEYLVPWVPSSMPFATPQQLRYVALQGTASLRDATSNDQQGFGKLQGRAEV